MKFEDITPGMRVAYVPMHANGNLRHPDVECGTVSSTREIYSLKTHPTYANSNNIVFVRFDKHVRRFGWEGATSQACFPDDLVAIELDAFRDGRLTGDVWGPFPNRSLAELAATRLGYTKHLYASGCEPPEAPEEAPF